MAERRLRLSTSGRERERERERERTCENRGLRLRQALSPLACPCAGMYPPGAEYFQIRQSLPPRGLFRHPHNGDREWPGFWQEAQDNCLPPYFLVRVDGSSCHVWGFLGRGDVKTGSIETKVYLAWSGRLFRWRVSGYESEYERGEKVQVMDLWSLLERLWGGQFALGL